MPRAPESALKEIRDAIGIRIVCGFIEDIYQTIEVLRQLEGCEIVLEKDYIRAAKPNGYRSYHLILAVETPYEDCHGQNPGRYFVEIQLRTIAMDSWASLEHQLKYKKELENTEELTRELLECAEVSAALDAKMEEIRKRIMDAPVKK